MQVSEIAEAAFECWWQDQHPGWMIFTLGNNHFESLDQIIKACIYSIMMNFDMAVQQISPSSRSVFVRLPCRLSASM